jgi:TonB family protein
MTCRSIFVLLVSLIPPCAPAQDVQQRAEALLDKARQLSDIRSPNAPGFRLKATFSFVGKNLDSVQGTYTEVWVSKSQWRRETVVNDQRRIEVGGPSRLWQLDSTADFPEQAASFPRVVDIFPSQSASLAFDSISDHSEVDPPTECAISKPNNRQLKSAFCFDKVSGLLVAKIFPGVRPTNAVEESCNYGSFQKIGDRRFPREMMCFEDRHRKLDAKVIELSFEPSPDPALFTPPRAAIELGQCAGKTVPPHAIDSPSPQTPFGSQGQSSQVTLSVVVDTNGKPQNVKVVNSAGAHSDEAALRAMRNWRFKPATCGGEPMPMMIEIQFAFYTHR